MISQAKLYLKWLLVLLPCLLYGKNLTWPLNQALPHFPEACLPLEVIDTDTLNFHQVALLSSIQGAFNASIATNCKTSSTGSLYLTKTVTEGKFNWLITRNIPYQQKSFEQILELYLPQIKCALVYDPDFPLSINLATHLAARRSCVITDPVLAKLLKAKNPKIDINAGLVGKYKNKYDLNKRLIEEIKKQNLHPPRVLLSLTPIISDGIRELAYELGEDAFIFYMTLLKDDTKLNYHWEHKPSWTIKAKSPQPKPALTLDDKEVLQVAELSGSLSPNTLAMGFYEGEVRSIINMSQHKIPTIVGTSYSNYSIWSSLREPLLIQKSLEATSLKLEKKLYLNLVVGDGDNMSYVQHFLKYVFDTWSGRGKYPLNWTIAPGLADAGPAIFNHFIKAATANDYFLAGPSGLGYVHPSKLSNNSSAMDEESSAIEQFWKSTGKYLSTTGLKVVNIVNERTHLDNAMGAVIRKHSPYLLGIVNDAIGLKDMNFRSYLLNQDLPVSSLEARVKNEQEFRQIIEARLKELDAADGPLFISLTVDAWNKNHDYVNKVIDESLKKGQALTALRSDQFFPLLKTHLLNQMPGFEAK